MKWEGVAVTGVYIYNGCVLGLFTARSFETYLFSPFCRFLGLRYGCSRVGSLLGAEGKDLL